MLGFPVVDLDCAVIRTCFSQQEGDLDAMAQQLQVSKRSLKLLLRKKEQQFVSQIIEQDNYSLQSKDKKDREISREMQEKWKEAMESLKKSHLKRQGNPLYVLPWYMIIGKSGTGKTTAIKSADLSSSFSEVSSVSGISGTRNCDWWFFEQAILIDTAGRYAIPVDGDRDMDEWQKFWVFWQNTGKKSPSTD